MTNQTIEQAVVGDWEQTLKEYFPTGLFARLLKTGEYVETTDAVKYIITNLLAAKDREIAEERERIIKNLSQLRQITVNGELFISAEAIKGEISNWSEYKIV